VKRLEAVSVKLGLFYFDANPKMTMRRTVGLLFHFCCVIFSINSAVQALPNFIETFKVCSFFGHYIQILAKIGWSIKSSQQLQDLLDSIHKYYRDPANATEPKVKIIAKYRALSERIIKVLFVSHVISCVVFNSNPIVCVVLSNNYVNVLPFNVPFINRETMTGFLINYLVQCTYVVVSSFTYATIEAIISVSCIHVITLVKILRLDLEELEALLVADPEHEKESEIRDKLRSIILKQKEIWEFIEIIKCVCTVPCFARIATSLITLCTSLVGTIFLHSTVSFSLLYAFFAQLFISFVCGAVLQHAVSHEYLRKQCYLILLTD